MEPEELTWRRTIEEEEDASTAAVEAERVLHQLVQRHLASSPKVDAAVAELDLRCSEYARKLRATGEADGVYHRAQWEDIIADRARRRADHEQRVQAVLQQARQASVTRSAVVLHSATSSRDDDPSPRPTKRLNLGRLPRSPVIQNAGSGEETVGSGGFEGSSSGDADDSSSSGDAGVSPPGPIKRLMLFHPKVHGVPPRPLAAAPTQAHTASHLSDCESESKSHHADSDHNVEEPESVEASEFLPSSESEDAS